MSTGATGNQGGGAGAATGGENTGNTAGNQSAGGNSGASGGSNTPWFSGFQNAELKGFVESKGYKSPEALADAYRNAEKHLGVPADRLLKLPTDMADDKAMGEVYARLGRPENADGYEVAVPEGLNDDFAKWAKEMFHGLGLSKSQGDKLAAKWNERVTAMNTSAAESQKVALQQQEVKLKQEWGAAFEQNVGQVNAFAEKIGLTKEDAAAMASVMGIDGLNKMMHGIITKFGLKLGEDTFRGSDGGSTGFQVLSPDGAKSKIKQLQSDKEWSSRYLNGGVKEQEEMRRLQRWSLGME